MQHPTVRFFSLKTLIITAVTVIGLGISLASTGVSPRNAQGNDHNCTAAGG